MSVSKFIPHVFVIPEDHRDEQIANGFVNHDQVKPRLVQVVPCVTGWRSVLDKFEAEYIPYLQTHINGHVILLIDYDGHYDSRREDFEKAIPIDLKERVFVVGAKLRPEDLKRTMGKTFEEIGKALADDCFAGTDTVWSHDQLAHNDPDRLRLVKVVKPFLFMAK